MNLSAINRARQQTPQMSMPLLPEAAMIPPTCVPWPLSSWGMEPEVMSVEQKL
jgi:hypothetical protein